MTAFEDYCAGIDTIFQRAFAHDGQAAVYHVGGQRWLIRSAGQPWSSRYLRALAHLRAVDVVAAESSAVPDLTVAVWDQATTGTVVPPPGWEWLRRLPHSYHTEFDADRCAVLLYTGIYILLDRAARQAWVWHPHGLTLPQWDFAAPLRDLIELWFKPTPLIRVHAGAVLYEDCGALIVGASGSGKSTTTIACLRAGLGYLGDDYVLIDPEQQRIYSLYLSGKLTPDTLARFPELAPHVANQDSIAEFKAILYFDALFPGQLKVEAPLRSVLLPTITHQPHTHLVPVSAMRALHALAPSTLFQAADPSPDDFSKISRLVRATPAFRLDAGTDLDHLIAQIKEHCRHA